MAIPVWPLTLPQTGLRTGYEENFPNNLLISQGDVGTGKVRVKGATPPFTFTVPMEMTTAQRGILKTFVQSTLKDGALRFEFTHPVDGTTFEARIVPVSDESLYTATPYGLNYMVSLKLMVLP